MNQPQHHRNEMYRLLWALHDGVLGDDDARRLRQFVLNNTRAREMFVRYAFLRASLEWDHSSRGAAGEQPAAAQFADVAGAALSWHPPAPAKPPTTTFPLPNR